MRPGTASNYSLTLTRLHFKCFKMGCWLDCVWMSFLYCFRLTALHLLNQHGTSRLLRNEKKTTPQPREESPTLPGHIRFRCKSPPPSLHASGQRVNWPERSHIFPRCDHERFNLWKLMVKDFPFPELSLFPADPSGLFRQAWQRIAIPNPVVGSTWAFSFRP